MKKINYLIWALGLLMSPCLTSCEYQMEDNPVDIGDIDVDSKKENIVEKTSFDKFIDNSIYAGDDFYLYGVNKWIAAHPVPQKEKKVSLLGEQHANSLAVVKKIASGEVGNDPVINQLIASYNKIDLDSDIKLLSSKVAEIDAVTDQEGIYKAMAKLMKNGYAAPLFIAVVNYERTAKFGLLAPENLGQVNLTAEDVKQFTNLDDDAANALIDAAQAWNVILSMPPTNSNQQNYTHHGRPDMVKMSISKTRGGSSTLYKELGLTDNFWVAQGTEDVLNLFFKFKLDGQKALLKYFIIDRDIDLIAAKKEKAVDALCSLFWKEYSITNTLLSRIYNETQIKPEMRELCKTLCEDHRTVFRERIQNLKWMGDATKQKAIEKLNEMIFFVGWPDKTHPEWEVEPVTAPTGYQAALKLYEQMMTLYNKLNGLTSFDALFYTDWLAAPSFTANAFYFHQNNSMSILSSNMVPPVYDTSLGDAYIYASLGSTIGHEMTHGFDSNGSTYNKYGKKENWWASADNKTFLDLQNKMIQHFDALVYYPEYNCDGEKTLAENIADLGGLNISYLAYMKYLEKKAFSKETLDYEAREFFRGYAYVWAENINKDGAEAYIEDVHAAGCLRVNGNVYQMDDFYRVFNIKDGKMFLEPEDRITIW